MTCRHMLGLLLCCASLTGTAVGETDGEKLAILERYAPRVWMAQGEEFFPSSVEWAFQHMTRVERHGQYWLYAKQELSSQY